MTTAHAVGLEIRAAVAAVPDPEIPTVTIEDLGILRDVELVGDRVVVTITPTYSGCPAMDAIRTDIRRALPGHDVEVRTVLAPAWTTDWITEAGQEKLRRARIAPPSGGAPHGRTLTLAISVRCPNCGSPDTRELSRFGSTACKSLWSCRACGDPFDHFKAI
ncbi:phenylacetate-CoA oxygenase subunit PaaJ [Longispora fulva]|uniref:Ring-1,2-phenylacetyl-CoA epoxidase subunit PaaD n=1 Tax=Longispora fulva TaxID=619741 RepID=A0A8J7GN48_9ACTN|nr:1,2-phenylacetyl-CoA epoxidase subunit PaaD [Longispora fulva]MBG6140003.1 ring-1,2-phenylacetyl-CoA epoxidase subunit PaaD [Longispora fulva]GIG57618.1 phenylacetate-CoA oxygenase subunit PaaJ [Longispora fulva]